MITMCTWSKRGAAGSESSAAWGDSARKADVAGGLCLRNRARAAGLGLHRDAVRVEVYHEDRGVVLEAAVAAAAGLGLGHAQQPLRARLGLGHLAADGLGAREVDQVPEAVRRQHDALVERALRGDGPRVAVGLRDHGARRVPVADGPRDAGRGAGHGVGLGLRVLPVRADDDRPALLALGVRAPREVGVVALHVLVALHVHGGVHVLRRQQLAELGHGLEGLLAPQRVVAVQAVVDARLAAHRVPDEPGPHGPVAQLGEVGREALLEARGELVHRLGVRDVAARGLEGQELAPRLPLGLHAGHLVQVVRVVGRRVPGLARAEHVDPQR
mmetsp:Transcript_2277/g.6761  ORF Transcript_2277/g.6761 Transcript_2277/m.6761 type:complete len:329 (+) Transcript_2277:64-1050(+)